MAHLGAGPTPARTVPTAGTQLWPVLGMGLACCGAAVGVVSHPDQIAPTGISAILIGAGAAALGMQRQRRATAGAIAEERRRIARDLHDGLAQELAYIKMETARMAAIHPEGRAARLATAAEHALKESRGAITALNGCGDGCFADELSEVAEGLAGREGARVKIHVERDLDVRSERREALLRIAREAITNGVRHGRATEVALELSDRDGLRMAVRDNGAGFAPGGTRRRGSFGLTSMQERAVALGGNLTVESEPGTGTLVEVNLP
jgi:signal transduction histidine kinase